MEITLLGRVPSKKNSRINTRSGRSFPSKKYSEWHKDASLQLLGKKKINAEELFFEFYMPDNRRTDLTNKAESLMDLLVDNEFIEDDCWQVIHTVHLISRGVDKDNPRCIIKW